MSETPRLSHLDAAGRLSMVDVSAKPESQRVARARARVRMQAQTLALLLDGQLAKGDAIAVARLAGIAAAKKTADLIPLCHPLMLTHIDVQITADADLPGVCIEATCALVARTGVEMEALCAASVAALAIYDMCKAVDRGMVIEQVALLEKSGGRSGHWRRQEL